MNVAVSMNVTSYIYKALQSLFSLKTEEKKRYWIWDFYTHQN